MTGCSKCNNFSKWSTGGKGSGDSRKGTRYGIGQRLAPHCVAERREGWEHLKRSSGTEYQRSWVEGPNGKQGRRRTTIPQSRIRSKL
ncbi:hypothetical protein SODALDRAFT_139746 [Sodiomyces alkalinus F11]|uniref:Uncharacterized protein n=1 Tax=Sodiomyces alkalinus (strain CBS 110278 / VKM F-3762 / F11) TaxID=1314773 RepID=A0A3N2PZA9_SODAK|nr:hypothetical protein SODALDRAFT_139746 [Sodiomyces alkalinus F11]ROT39863.1 hypothetical protein SODALDRAFT_139746 [Sodiomyces alkalinus F11]